MATSWRTTHCVSPTSLMRTQNWREVSGATNMAGAQATVPEAGHMGGPQALGCPVNLRMLTSLWDCWYPHSMWGPSSARREPPSATSPSRQEASKYPLRAACAETDRNVAWCCVCIFSEDKAAGSSWQLRCVKAVIQEEANLVRCTISKLFSPPWLQDRRTPQGECRCCREADQHPLQPWGLLSRLPHDPGDHATGS